MPFASLHYLDGRWPLSEGTLVDARRLTLDEWARAFSSHARLPSSALDELVRSEGDHLPPTGHLLELATYLRLPSTVATTCRGVLASVRQAVEDGALVVLRTPVHADFSGEAIATEEAAAKPDVDEAKEFFELVLTCSATGKPLAGISLMVRTPSRAEERANTDLYGVLRIPSLPSGSCEITSVIAGARVETSYKITGHAPPFDPANRAPSASPPSTGLQFLVHATSYRVATGDTPQSIAQSAAMSWDEIAEFNWGTRDPAELEERYREELGCLHRTDDGKRYRFDDADDPGVLLIPRPWQATLEVGRPHRFSAAAMRPLFISLQNEFGLRLPGAGFRLRVADGTEHTGYLGRSGIARLTGLPEGAFAISYPDEEDLLARSLAASVRKAFDEQATGPLFHLLGQTPEIVQRARAVYATHFNDLSGKGLEGDIDQVVTDPAARRPVLSFSAQVGLRIERAR